MAEFILLSFISIIIIILFIKRKKLMVITIIISLAIIAILYNPSICISASIRGLKLFVFSVFPSLFPFLILTYFLLAYDGVRIYSKLLGNILCKPLNLPKDCSIILLISAICGYPLGAKYACDLYNNKLIDKKNCEKLINIASNPSPLFIVGAVGSSMLQNTKASYIILISVYISALFMGFIIKSGDIKLVSNINFENKYSYKKLHVVMKESLDNAMAVLTNVCSYIIIFSVLSAYIKDSKLIIAVLKNLSKLLNINGDVVYGFFMGAIEMTNGCNIISNANTTLITKLCIISFIVSFSGFSIISQVSPFIKESGFSIIKYSERKLLQGILCSFTCFTLCKILPQEALYSFAPNNANNAVNLYTPSIIMLLLLVFFLILYKIKKTLFNIS